MFDGETDKVTRRSESHRQRSQIGLAEAACLTRPAREPEGGSTSNERVKKPTQLTRTQPDESIDRRWPHELNRVTCEKHRDGMTRIERGLRNVKSKDRPRGGFGSVRDVDKDLHGLARRRRGLCEHRDRDQ